MAENDNKLTTAVTTTIGRTLKPNKMFAEETPFLQKAFNAALVFALMFMVSPFIFEALFQPGSILSKFAQFVDGMYSGISGSTASVIAQGAGATLLTVGIPVAAIGAATYVGKKILQSSSSAANELANRINDEKRTITLEDNKKITLSDATLNKLGSKFEALAKTQKIIKDLKNDIIGNNDATMLLEQILNPQERGAKRPDPKTQKIIQDVINTIKSENAENRNELLNDAFIQSEAEIIRSTANFTMKSKGGIGFKDTTEDHIKAAKKYYGKQLDNEITSQNKMKTEAENILIDLNLNITDTNRKAAATTAISEAKLEAQRNRERNN